MSLISETGSYRGVVLEHAVAATSSGLPQMVLKVRALEQYEGEEKVWMDFQDREDNEITAYLVLFKKNGDPIFHVKDVMRVFEWDGKSLVGLNGLDLEGAEVQFAVEEHTYEQKTSMQVQNIRAYEDEPGNSLKKLDAGDLDKLNAQFSAQLKSLGGAPKVASAKAPAALARATTKKTTKKKTTKKTTPKPPAAPTAEPVVEEATELPVEEAVEEFQKAPPKPPKSTPAATAGNDTSTYEGSWAECCERRAEGVTDEILGQAFTRAMYAIAPNQSEEEIAAEDWQKITDTVTAETGVFAS